MLVKKSLAAAAEEEEVAAAVVAAAEAVVAVDPAVVAEAVVAAVVAEAVVVEAVAAVVAAMVPAIDALSAAARLLTLPAALALVLLHPRNRRPTQPEAEPRCRASSIEIVASAPTDPIPDVDTPTDPTERRGAGLGRLYVADREVRSAWCTSWVCWVACASLAVLFTPPRC